MSSRILLISYLVIWLLLAIRPSYRDDWLLENLLVFVAAPIVVWLHHRRPFSTGAAALLWLFFILHAIGAHYTYAEMPWLSQLADYCGWQRNHYDRIVHFLFGLLLFRPLFEQLSAAFTTPGSRLIVALLILFSASGFYEIVEWLAAQWTHPELGTAFLGTQGDQWDAQKDMVLAHLGALMAALYELQRSKRMPS
nr:DUF2238 domain-containing protein [uncultured Desulfuromonas sp.]